MCDDVDVNVCDDVGYCVLYVVVLRCVVGVMWVLVVSARVATEARDARGWTATRLVMD